MKFIYKKNYIWYLALVALNCVVANNCYSLAPSVGMEVGRAIYPFKDEENLFNRSHTKINLFTSLALSENFGVEVGMEKASSRRTSALGKNVFTTRNYSKIPTRNRIKSKISGFYFSLYGKYYLKPDLSMIGGIGFKNANFKFNRKFSSLNGLQFPEIRMSRTKCVPRLSGSIKYDFMKNLALRGTVVWENTSNILLNTSFKNRTLKFNNALHYTLGIVYQM